MKQVCDRLLKMTSPDQIIERLPFDFFDAEDKPPRHVLTVVRGNPIAPADRTTGLCLNGTVITGVLAACPLNDHAPAGEYGRVSNPA